MMGWQDRCAAICNGENIAELEGCRHCYGQDVVHVGTTSINGQNHADLAHPASRSRLSHWRDSLCPIAGVQECSVAGMQGVGSRLGLACSVFKRCFFER